jgi:bifunctional N-acetylglucosamine-1-phosphate-uridyltransferase/glucosamine-1-phosphate-acetyltransferase GlmU-like protein
MLKPADFFDLSKNPFEQLFRDAEYVWDPLKKLGKYIRETIKPNVSAVRKSGSLVEKTVILYDGKVVRTGVTIDTTGKKPVVKKNGQILDGASIIFAGVFLWDDEISIGNNTVVEPGALIKGPTIIGNNTEVRQGAYIRGDVLVGNGCVVGHTTELKSCVMLGGSKAGHFAYIGDSILGTVNLGAGTKLANLKIIESPVNLNINGKKYETGLRKFGAILADGVETGCNSVTAPGTLLGKDALLYPNATARGYYPPKTIIKLKQSQELRERE